MERNKLTGHHLRMVAVTLMWGGAFVAGRFTVGEVPPFTVAFLRFALAGALLWVPLWTMLLARVLLGEKIMPVMLLGGLLIITGVYLTSRTGGSAVTTLNAAGDEHVLHAK